jgi:hypothetical protein
MTLPYRMLIVPAVEIPRLEPGPLVVRPGWRVVKITRRYIGPDTAFFRAILVPDPSARALRVVRMPIRIFRSTMRRAREEGGWQVMLWWVEPDDPHNAWAIMRHQGS